MIPAPSPPPPPRVLPWYRAYAVAMALLYILCFLGGIAFFFFADELAAADDEVPAALWIVYGLLLTGLGVLLAAAYVAALFLPPKPWTWIYHLVLIAIGMTSCCCMPVSIPLMVYWFKPETQAYFGRGPAAAPAPVL